MTDLKRLIAIVAAGIISLSMASCTKSNANNDTSSQQTSVTVTESNTQATTSQSESVSQETVPANTDFVLSDIPKYSGEAFITVNDNTPYFDTELLDRAKHAVSDNANLYSDSENGNEEYLPLDELGRCRTATALLSKDTMPLEDEDRDAIGMIKPAGWHTIKYPDVITDLYLYNRCHLIGWQLGAENANEYNLTTGTRYLNMEGMLPFENQTADYIRSTSNHVLYRVTPVFIDNELVCRGILMEAKSIEDDGLQFCTYCYNVQPYIRIDYLTGDSEQISEAIDTPSADIVSNGDGIPKQNLDAYDNISDNTTKHYILNTNSKKIHDPNCKSVQDMNESNKQETDANIDQLIEDGYEPCKICNPS